MSKNAKREIQVSGGVYNEGENYGIQVGGDLIGRDQYNTGLNAGEIQQLFAPIYKQIESKTNFSPEIKEDLKADVKEVEQEVSRGQDIDESFLNRRLRNIGRMAPDIFEVVIATLTNPASGFTMVVRKIAERANAFVNQ